MTRSPLAALGSTAAAITATLALAACSGPADPDLPSFSSSPTPPPVGTWANVPAEPTAKPDVTLEVVAYSPDRRITGTQASACMFRGQLPDPACTPGAVAASADPNDDPAKAADQAEVCNAGFADRHRPVGTAKFKVAAMKAYHVPTTDIRVVEYDHLVPLSLGGANDVRNLWPQRSDLPGQGFRNSKDDLETRMWRAVCVYHSISLVDAQRAFARQWTGAEAFVRVPPR
jgi:hypothetical protein